MAAKVANNKARPQIDRLYMDIALIEFNPVCLLHVQ
jgi:hypothetical protein